MFFHLFKTSNKILLCFKAKCFFIGSWSSYTTAYKNTSAPRSALGAINRTVIMDDLRTVARTDKVICREIFHAKKDISIVNI